jgi:hypothetical protein
VEPIIGRLKRALKLEAGVFQEIGADPAATVQAIIVVVAAALIGGLGALIGPGEFGFGSWIFSGIFSVVGLAVGAGIIYLVSRLFKAQGDYMSLFRSLGYASAPQALSIIPIVGGIVGAIWSIILAIRAVKETQTVGDGTAVAIVLIPAAIVFVILLILVLAVGMAILGLGAAAASS